MGNLALRPTGRGQEGSGSPSLGPVQVSNAGISGSSVSAGGVAPGSVTSEGMGDTRDTSFGRNYVKNGAFTTWTDDNKTLGGHILTGLYGLTYAYWLGVGGFANQGIDAFGIVTVTTNGYDSSAPMVAVNDIGKIWQTIDQWSDLKGQWFSCSCMVLAGAASAARIYIATDTETIYSDYHDGNDTWSMLTVQLFIPTTATRLEVGCCYDETTHWAGFDNFMGCKGLGYQSFASHPVDMSLSAPDDPAGNLKTYTGATAGTHVEYGTVTIAGGNTTQQLIFNTCFDVAPQVFCQSSIDYDNAAWPATITQMSFVATRTGTTGNLVVSYLAVGLGRRKYYWYHGCYDTTTPADGTLVAGTGSAITSSLDFGSRTPYSWKSVSGTSAVNHAWAYATLPDTYNTIYAQCYLYAKTGDVTWADGNVYCMTFGVGAVALVRAGINTSGHVCAYNVHKSEQYDSTTDMTFDAWHVVEMKAVRDAAWGEVHVWFDGVEVVTQTALDTSTTDFTRVSFGIKRDVTTAATIYVTDCRISSQYLGYSWS
jgi:hypothetical protein